MTDHPASKPHAVIITGTPDAPAFKRRPLAFVIALVVYTAVIATFIVYAVQLRRQKNATTPTAPRSVEIDR